MKTMTRSEFERDVSQLLDQVSGSSDSVLITSDGQPAFTVEIKPVAVAALERNAVLRERLRGAVIEFIDPTLPAIFKSVEIVKKLNTDSDISKYSILIPVRSFGEPDV